MPREKIVVCKAHTCKENKGNLMMIWNTVYLEWYISLPCKGFNQIIPINYCPMCGEKLE